MSSTIIPLFPLNTVLFPNTPILLHIFEERYKLMMRRCLLRREQFGVVMSRGGVEGEILAEVGCSADIVQVERLAHGRLNLIAMGKERFRILRTQTQQAYLQAEVQRLPLAFDLEEAMVEPLSAKLRFSIELYASYLNQIIQSHFRWDKLPAQPLDLAYFASFVIQLSPLVKQQLLETSSAKELWQLLSRHYHTETLLLEAMVRQQTANRPDLLHSLN